MILSCELWSKEHQGHNSTFPCQRVLLSTLNCHVAMETPCNLLKKGDAVEDAEVVRVTKRGVYISLENGLFNESSILVSELLKV